MFGTYFFRTTLLVEKTERLDFRLTTSNRKLIERAALLLGQPLTAFAVQALVRQAEQVIEQDTQRKLSARDWETFVKIIGSKKQPNAALVKAAKRFAESKRATKPR